MMEDGALTRTRRGYSGIRNLCSCKMEITLLVALCLTLVTSLPLCHDETCILKVGAEFLRKERSKAIGGNITLNELEQRVDSEILIPLKKMELKSKTKVDIQNLSGNSLFKFLRKMPKGGDLHIHDIAMVNIQWVVKELTYLPDLYYCITDSEQILRFIFSEKFPVQEHECKNKWLSVEEKRKDVGSDLFDLMLHDKMTITFDRASDPDSTWDRFINGLEPVGDLAYTEKGFRPYFKQALTEAYEDNVLYLEVRTLLLPILCDNGTTFDREETLRRYIEVTEEFKKENPGFIGAKFILISVRSLPADVMETDLRLAVTLRQKYPDYVLGFDVVGYENDGPPHKDLLDVLLIPSREAMDLPFFFHAGETQKFGSTTDANILYTILLNTTRIGHGFALAKHPDLLQVVADRGIPIEVPPISNQVLSFVNDLSNHPGVTFFSRNLPVVISSDDPGSWRTSGLSYDYFAAFKYFTRADDGLRALKEMSRNGIKYSAMKENEKITAMEVWQQNWDQFIKSNLQGYESTPDPIQHMEL